MKTFFSAIFLAVCITGLHAQSRMEAAKKTAKDHHELILLNFSGSDWCVPCIKLHKNIIDTEEFRQLESDNVIVYLNADFPRNKKNQPEESIKKENEHLADTYNPKGIFPYTILLDSEGKVLKTWEGLPSENALAFVTEIKSMKDSQN